MQINKATKALLSAIHDEDMRCVMEREDKAKPETGSIIHELISPLLYLRLECHNDDSYSIHYGFTQGEMHAPYYVVTASFIRMLYKLTMEDDIQDSIKTDWVITECAELFEYMLDRNKYHTIKVLAYRPKQRRYLKSVA